MGVRTVAEVIRDARQAREDLAIIRIGLNAKAMRSRWLMQRNRDRFRHLKKSLGIMRTYHTLFVKMGNEHRQARACAPAPPSCLS
jgi:hypothetical protein